MQEVEYENIKIKYDCKVMLITVLLGEKQRVVLDPELPKERLLELSPAGSRPNQEGGKGEPLGRGEQGRARITGESRCRGRGREKVRPSADLSEGPQAWSAACPGSSRAGANGTSVRVRS